MAVSAATLIAIAGCKQETQEAENKEVQLETMDQKVSYILGSDIAERIKAMDFDLNTDAFVMALNDVRNGVEPRINDEEMRAVMTTFQAEQQAKHQEKMNKATEENLTKGQEFLTENATKEGVTQTESGLQYKVIEAGEGETPSADDVVKVHYRGRLLDGTEFDSSYKRDQPATFPVGNLIPGWVEALQLMKVGGKWEIYVPADLAYGPGGTPNIPPNSTLIFEMELLEIVDQNKAASEEGAQEEGAPEEASE